MENITVNQNDKCIEIIGELDVLSSAPHNGGFAKTDRIVNLNTPEDEEGPVRDFIREQLPLSAEEANRAVGFVTAADVSSAYLSEVELDGGRLFVALTAGVGDPIDCRYHRTINVIVVTDLNLTQTSMANLFIVVTEAKTAALRELDVIKNGRRITGTPTDAVAVAVTGYAEGHEVLYSGTATQIGQATFDLVKEGVMESLEDNNGYRRDRSILSRLAERGVTRRKILESATAMVVGEHDEGDLERRFTEAIERFAGDPNVYFLLASALHLEEERERSTLEGDPGNLIADELIGIDLAEYIGGKNALFNFIRYDREKPGVLSKLPPFLDDAVGGLIAGTMTRIFAGD